MALRLPRVLIIEDDADLRGMLQSMLSHEGFSVETAEDGPSALVHIERGGIDLLIADINLPPPMDGVETVRRARAKFPGLRSLYVSGREKAPWHNPALDDFVSKPFNARELIGCVCELWWRSAAPV